MSIDVTCRLSLGDFELDVDLSLPSSGVSAIFGPSGCGKTTLLRTIAGLQPNPGGRVMIDGVSWQGDGTYVPVHQRRIGYVFQDAGLFTHLSVQGNLRYGLRRRGGNHPSTGPGYDDIVSLMGIERLISRRIDRLSGGERQRVAIAQALLSNPRLLLMDEPLASLDLASKRSIMPLLENLHRELAIPILYVSHAPEEVARLADTLVFMAEGRITGQGPLQDIISRIESPIADRDEAFTILDCLVEEAESDYHLSQLRIGGQQISIPRSELVAGQRVRLRIQARDVSICLDLPNRTSILNVLPAVITEMGTPSGTGQQLVRLLIEDQPVLARISELSCHRLGLAPGQRVYAQMKAMALLS